MAAAAVVLVVGAAAVVTTLASSPGDGGASDVLDVPPPGDVAGENLSDETPVWVVHQEDGDVVVLAGTSEPDEWLHGAPVFCPGGPFFESLLGSRFDLDGRRLGGPAPGGLPRYDVAVDDGSVEVVDTAPVANDDPGEPPYMAARPAPIDDLDAPCGGTVGVQRHPSASDRS